MKTFKYVGEENHRPGHGLNEVVTGDEVQVDDPAVSAELAGDPRWKHIPDRARSRTAKKAAQKRPAEKDAPAPVVESVDADNTPEG